MEYTSEMLHMKYVYEWALKNDGGGDGWVGGGGLHNRRNGFVSQRNEMGILDILP